MEFERAVRRRRMVRRFDPDRPVGRPELDRLLDLARRAPSAGHTQGWHFLVLDRPANTQRFWTATADPDVAADRWLTGLRTAPALIVCWSDRDAYEQRYAEPDKRRVAVGPGIGSDLARRWPVAYWDIDVGMAAMVVLLAAADVGLAVCLFAVPTDRVAAVRAAFDVPERFTPVAVVAVGHPHPADTTSASAATTTTPATTAATGSATGSARRGRRPWTEIVSYGRYGRSGAAAVDDPSP